MAEGGPSHSDAGDRASVSEDDLVARQIGRVPRRPWRVAVRCQWARPSVIASPSRLADGTPFPTLYWLTCPWLIESIGALESAGLIAEWDERLSRDAHLAASLEAADARLLDLRARESGGVDVCASVGVAGRASATHVKCLHAHVALALAGVHDPVGAETLSLLGEACDDDACAAIAARGDASGTKTQEP